MRLLVADDGSEFVTVRTPFAQKTCRPLTFSGATGAAGVSAAWGGTLAVPQNAATAAVKARTRPFDFTMCISELPARRCATDSATKPVAPAFSARRGARRWRRARRDRRLPAVARR